MKSHSVIYIGDVGYERLERRKGGFVESVKAHVDVPLRELPYRIGASFLPPLGSAKSRKVYVDLVGPLLAVLCLAFLLHYGHASKHPSAALHTSPSLALLYYCATVPSLCYFLVRLGGSSLGAVDLLALVGYGLYGHVLTLLVSLSLDDRSGNSFFFLAMAVFGGLTGLRIVLVLLLTIPRPPARLLVCSLVSIMHLLFLVFIQFAYMHRTFVYGKNPHHPNYSKSIP